MVFNIFQRLIDIQFKLGLVFFLICFSLTKANVDQILDYIGTDPEHPIPSEDISLLEEIFTSSRDNQILLIKKISELSFLSSQDLSILSQNSSLSELLHQKNTSETLNLILTQLENYQPTFQSKGLIKHTLTESQGFRYRWNGWIQTQSFHGGFSVERDPGEENIMDGYSGYMERKNDFGQWIFGDHQIISGFGLVSGRTFPITKSFGSMSGINRMGKGLAPFKSSHESWGLRGIGLSMDTEIGNWVISLSQNHHDGNVDENGDLHISDTGDHQSFSALKRKNNLSESALISRWELHQKNIHFGIIGYHSIWKSPETNSILIQSMSLAGIFKRKRASFFGEFAFEGEQSKRWFMGVKIPVPKGFYILTFRIYNGQFQTYRSNPFSEYRGSNLNETGLFQGLSYNFGSNKLLIFTDLFTKNQNEIAHHFRPIGMEAGFRWENRNQFFQWRFQWKQSWKTEDEDSHYMGTTKVSYKKTDTIKGTLFYRPQKSVFSNKLEISNSRFKNDIEHFRSIGIQEKLTMTFTSFAIEFQWIVVNSQDFTSRLYFWDVNLPGEMRSRVFTSDSHSPAVKILFSPSSTTRVGCRYRLIWSGNEFHPYPKQEGALLVETIF
jgi:hypothetical protein